ncbi:uncharacterized protein LAJ45_02735 [Morchella importuna]|uniref:uncharacterized protein n=1 Tax=Morchella importuna TaxID=1174673 RepID=UPI001E8DD9FD|nr:uncharacterized protein LAJ45_02735 [Morchella importuna]KAH8153148.1 hypothetical protein LAJ45_02735 [Morchella importuna]
MTVQETKGADASHDGYHLTDKDAKQLETPDESFKLMTWEDLKLIIENNRLEDLKRVPSDLRRYISWSKKTREEYGTILAFILKERLGWKDLKPQNLAPFACEADTKVLINDWPYGNAPGILHIVCWTKAPIATQPDSIPAGDLTPESREIIDSYVNQTFKKHLGKENVLWFKNWASIQSVRSVEHIHVLVRGASEEFLKSVIGVEGDGLKIKGIGQLEKEKGQGQCCE